MKHTRTLPLVVLAFWLSVAALSAQTDTEQILATRNASNQALRAYDNEKVLSYLTADALTTTGNGTLLPNKNALKEYIFEGGKSTLYWVRTATEIVVNEKRGLAWENGTWNGYDPKQSDDAIIGGNYSAMWTKASGEWKIKSQLFVTIKEK